MPCSLLTGISDTQPGQTSNHKIYEILRNITDLVLIEKAHDKHVGHCLQPVLFF